MSFARCRGWEKGNSHLTLELEGGSSTPCMVGNARPMFPWHLHCCVCSQWCCGYGVGMLLWYPSACSDSCLLCSAEPKKSLHVGKREPGLSPEVGMGLL